MAKKRPKSKGSKQSLAAKKTSITDTINNEVIAEALSSINQPVLLKVCRLCESKDGPFLNIFDPDQITAKKIEELMPFGIAENDDLPHKICFRCSAKLEELYEFIQKCINTQESLQKALGKKGPIIPKVKTRKIWEEKLNQSNMTNDDICDALIKKAMAGIKDIPLVDLPLTEETPPPTAMKEKSNLEPEPIIKIENIESDEVPIKNAKLSIDKCDQKSSATRSSRSSNPESVLDGVETTITRRSMSKKAANQENSNKQPQEELSVKKVSNDTQQKKTIKSINQFSNDFGCSDEEIGKIDTKLKDKQQIENEKVGKNKSVNDKVEPTVEEAKPFNIMDHVSKIKVNGVGVLFQCKLCNRNFLKKEVVVSHDCAKKGKPKIDIPKHLPPPEPPKITTVKYIKIDDDFRKSLNSKPDLDIKKVSSQDNKTNVANLETMKSAPESKPKPKIGPASKVKRDMNNLSSSIGMTIRPRESSPPGIQPPESVSSNSNPVIPSIQFPSIPSLNSRYKLVPGPNNTFTLVEEKNAVENNTQPEEVVLTKSMRKRKSDDIIIEIPVARKQTTETSNKSKAGRKTIPEVIHSDNNFKQQDPVANQQPYPVGLFQTMPHHSSIYVPPVNTEQAVFTTPAMKKQSYTIVQTGNPSKLLISTKPQPPVEELPKKRQKKSKAEVKDVQAQQPFSVTLEDSSPPKDAGFFTFINVDPLLQPSYVLPTDNIIQESQISTSTPAERNAAAEKDKDKDKYSCNMCGEKFSREKKLLAHIQSHYTKMDEEDQIREKSTKKRSRK